MSETGALDAPKSAQRAGPWTRRLVTFLRVMAGVSMLKGMYHWALVLGVGDGAGSTFENSAMPWQAATIFFAVIDLVAAVGLWLAAAWGGVVWLTSTISMAAIELFFPQVYGGRTWIALLEFVALASYVGLAVMAGRERPE
ncbi:MAG: hypothetical protein JO000_17035 [Alphaproteobacteria bacterium]|nr:hypothetical protein [Alphaproteobacteria bacterium]